jgi:hypothetical protein
MSAPWEIWAPANMLVSARGEVAEEYADEQIARAIATGNKVDEIVWRAIAQGVVYIRTDRHNVG